MTTCVLYESMEAARVAGGGEIPEGAMWPAEDPEREGFRAMLAPYYLANNAHRPPLWVKLPGQGGWFCLDWKASSGGEGWEVKGDAPNLTVTPSILVSIPAHGDQPARELWHGHLTDGILRPC